MSSSLESLSNDALAYEIVHKRLRNPIVGWIRTCLKNEFGDEWEAALRKPFKEEEWDSISRASSLAADTGVVARRAIDGADLLSVNHFYGIFDKYFLVLMPPESVPVGDAGKQVKSSVLRWFKEIKDIRDPNAHPPDSDLPVFDALRVADTASRVLRMLRLDIAVDELEEVRSVLLSRAVADGIPDESRSTSVLSTLPPREEMYDRFIGREVELEELWSWYADPESHRWVLVGEGGKGKSAIAYRFAASILFDGPADLVAVLWLSAKRRRYADSETVDVANPDFWDLDSALDRLLDDLGLATEKSKTTEAKRIQVLALLRDLPCLVVVDDLDSIAVEEEDVVEFFTYEVPRTCSRVLITSRRLYPGMGRASTRVAGLPYDDAVTFIRSQAERLGLAQRPDLPPNYKKIVDVTEGSPLYIEDLMLMSRHDKVGKAINRWVQVGGDSARRYALQRERELLGALGRDVLDACCLAGRALSVVQLSRILGRTEDDVEGGLRELERNFLLPESELLEGVPVFRAHRNLEVLLRRDLRNDPSRASLRAAVDGVIRGADAGLPEEAIIRQVTVLLKAARPVDALEVVDRAVSQHDTDAVLLALRAEVFSRQDPPRMTEARDDWERAYELGLKRSESFQRWSEAEANVEDWRRAYEAATRGLERVGQEHARLNQAAGYAASRLGQARMRSLDQAQAGLDLGKAERHLRVALRGFRSQTFAESAIGRTYRALVINAQAMGETSQAQYWAERWISEQPTSHFALAERERQGLPKS